MIVKQLLLGTMDVFTYIVGCEATKEAVVIDPGGEADRRALQDVLTCIRHGCNYSKFR